MNSWLWLLGQNAIIVALMLPFVLLTCRLFRNRPAVQHVLWVVVLLKFITPPIVSWPWTVEQMGEAFWSIPAPGSVEQTAASPPIPERDGLSNVSKIPGIPSDPGLGKASVIVDPGDTPFPEPPTTWTSISVQAIAATWFLGVILSAVLQLRRIARHAVFVRRGTTAPEELNTEIKAAAKRLGMCPPRAVLARGIMSPFVWCLGCLRLVWPESLGNATAIARSRGIIAHELAHVRRRDHWVAWLDLVAGILCWWNPLYWYVRRRLRETAEMACDALAIATNPENRREYAEMLLELSADFKNGAPAPVLAVGAGTPSSFERRLSMILSHHVSGKMSSCGILAAIGFTLVTLPSWSLGQAKAAPEAALAGQEEKKPTAEKPVEPVAKSPPSDKLLKTLLGTERRWYEAMSLRDEEWAQRAGEFEKLKGTLASDFQAITGWDELIDGRGFVKMCEKIRINRYILSEPHLIQLGTESAVLTYKLEEHVADSRGGYQAASRISSTWALRDGRWVNIFHQATKIYPGVSRATADVKKAKGEWADLKGDWDIVSVEIDGRKSEPKDLGFNRCTILAPKPGVVAGTSSVGWFIYFLDKRLFAEFQVDILDPTTKPMSLQLQAGGSGPLDPDRTAIRDCGGIYRLDGDKLTVCLSKGVRSGKPGRPEKFTADTGTGQTLIAFKRHLAAEKKDEK